MLFNPEDWENIIHFGNLLALIGKKTYFLALGTIPVTGVGFIARKTTENVIVDGKNMFLLCLLPLLIYIHSQLIMSGVKF